MGIDSGGIFGGTGNLWATTGTTTNNDVYQLIYDAQRQMYYSKQAQGYNKKNHPSLKKTGAVMVTPRKAKRDPFTREGELLPLAWLDERVSEICERAFT